MPAKKQIKKVKSKQTKKWSLPWLLLVLFSLSLVLSVVFLKNSLDQATQISFSTIRQTKIPQSSKKPDQEKIVVSIPQAKAASVSPNPVTIPENFGRSITVPILTYHYVGNNPNPEDTVRDNLSVTPDRFEKQMEYIAQNGYNTITLDTMYAALKGNAALPPKPLILTFDDGYIDFFVNAYPILRKYNIRATQFIPTGLMGQSYYMFWDQVKQMQESGLIDFQAHSLTHPNMTTLSDEKLRYEMTESKTQLQNVLGHPVNFMAYPYGASNGRVWKAAQDAGYVGAVGTWYGNVISEGNIYNMPRIKIAGEITLEEFAKRF